MGTRTRLVLYGDPLLPASSGKPLRVLHLARQLARNDEVHVAALGGDPSASAAHEPFELVEVPHRRHRVRAALKAPRLPYASGLQQSRQLHALVADGIWSSVQASLPHMVPAALQARRPVVLDAHNVETDLLRSVAALARGPRRAWLKHQVGVTERFERWAAQTVDAVCATSDEDAAVFEAWRAREVILVPNGVDTDFVQWAPPARGGTLLYIGQLAYEPNAHAVRELVSEVLPLIREHVPDAGVRLVGRGAELHRELAGPAVDVIGEVADVRSELHTARVTVIPLRAGGGTRLKVLEALAAGTPVVATPVAVAGLQVRDGEHVLLADSPQEIAAATVRVIRDDALAMELSRAGRRLVERQYDWGTVSQPLLELHERLSATERGRVPV